MDTKVTTPVLDIPESRVREAAALFDRPTVRRRWYVTAPVTETRYVDGQQVLVPVSEAHAKRVGTMTTACGRSADSWRKVFDLPFPLSSRPIAGADVCRECLAVVLEEQR